MDKHNRRFIDDNSEPTKIIDLDDAYVREDDAQDIDTLYEVNEETAFSSKDEPTRVIKKVDRAVKSEKKSDKADEKEKKRQEKLKEKNAKKLEKLMKKQQRREDRSDRETLSYEDMPLQERSAPIEKTHKPIKKRVIAVVLILVILFGVVFVFANSDKVSWHNIRNYVKYGILNEKGNESFPVSIQGENVDVGNFVRMGQDISCASDTKLQIINNYGRSEFTTQHGFTNPVLATSSQYALIYNLGGVGFQINTYEETVYAGEAENRILKADITDNGTYALVTTSNGYLSKLQVYNKENEKIFGYSFADYYVTDISLAPNGKNAVVTGLSALNGSEISSVYVLDFTKDKPVYLEEVTDNIFYATKYLNDGSACAIGNSVACVINTRNGNFNTVEYDGSHLACYDINRDTASFSVALSHSGDGRNCEILSINSDGKVTDSFATEYMVKYISLYKGRVALLTPDVIYLYAKDGGKISEQKVNNEPRAAVLYTTSDAYILDTNEISTLSI